MELYNMGVRGGLKKINKISFGENQVYLIDDYKTLYLWIGKKIPEKTKEFCIKKVNTINEKRDPPASIQVIYQNKEYGAFIAIIDLLKKGLKKDTLVERRPELELQYEDTIELVDAGIDPDLEAEITLSAHKISQKKNSYEELCHELAEIQINLIKEKGKATKKEIDIKAKEIYQSSSTYEELCWLIAELTILTQKRSFTKQ
ncbi:MAG: hypothetical protein EU532_05830 [Promethearchaeota archaeon]|nr:MAG: hypothetical protein EU532_05830 [Candidatus Lokiarchaeota archaeon]